MIGVLGVARSAEATTITSHSCTVQADNTMRFDCTVDLSNSDTVRIGFRPQAGGSWNWSDWETGDPVSFVLYNFQPDVAYEYRVSVAVGPVSAVTALTGGPSLPADLGDLNLVFTKRGGDWHSSYVMFDTRDCQKSLSYLVAVQVDGEYISWYQDIAAASDRSGAEIHGWRYTANDTVMVIVDQAEVFEWGLDGSEIWHRDFSADCSADDDPDDMGPCPHHDAFRGPGIGTRYVLTATADLSLAPADAPPFAAVGCGATRDGFVSDGYRKYLVASDHTLMGDMDYDPAVDAGPNGASCASNYWNGTFSPDYLTIDWTHVNSIFVTQAGPLELVTLSSRQWSEIIRYNPATGAVVWKLNGKDPAGYGDLTIVNDPGITYGDTYFGGQHHVTESDGHLLLFDNRMNLSTTRARAIELDIDTGSGEATITKSWEMRTPTYRAGLTCDHLGSAVYVPGTYGNSVLADCGPQTIIQEIDEYDGDTTLDPTLEIEIDQTGSACKSTSVSAAGMMWYRAWPLIGLGEF